MAEASCKDCKVERGYRPMLDYVSLCSLHTAAAELLNVLNKAAKLAHRNAKNHNAWLSFRECPQASCKAAAEALRKAEGR